MRESGKSGDAKARAPMVLVVDDAPDNREMYVEYLEAKGYRVIEAADGEAAVVAARAQLPDLVIMDLTLPVMDRWQAARILKADALTATIPLAALTGLAVTAREAKDAGFVAVLEKPCLPDLLLRTVEVLTRDARCGTPPG